MSKNTETIFSELVDNDLKKVFGIYCFNENIQQAAKIGTPDRLLCIGGRFIGLELKTYAGVASKAQLMKLHRIRVAGGIALLVTPSNWPSILNKLLDLL